MMSDDLMLEPSILISIKKVLQIPADYDEYDQDILMHLNSALNDVSDLGIGPMQGFVVYNQNATWDQFIGDENFYQSVKSLVFLKVKLLFDPPTNGFAVTAMEKQILQAEWRLNVRREATDYLDPATGQSLPPHVPRVVDGGVL